MTSSPLCSRPLNISKLKSATCHDRIRLSHSEIQYQIHANSPRHLQALRSSPLRPMPLFKLFGCEYGMQKGDGKREAGWTRKRPGQKCGSDNYQAPLRKGSVRQSPRDQPQSAYYSQKEAGSYDSPGQLPHRQGSRLDGHPALFPQQDAQFARQDATVRKSSAHPSRRQTVHHQPGDAASLPRGLTAPTQAMGGMGPPQGPFQDHSVHYSNHSSQKPIQRSERGSGKAPTQAMGGMGPPQGLFQNHSVHYSNHSSQNLIQRSERGSRHLDGPIHPSRADDGMRQYTVHNDFAKAPDHTGSARAGSTKQKAMLYGAKKEVTLADF